MKINKNIMIVFVGILLTACSGESENKQSTATGVIPAQQLQALENAKNVEQQLIDAQSDRLKEVN